MPRVDSKPRAFSKLQRRKRPVATLIREGAGITESAEFHSVVIESSDTGTQWRDSRGLDTELELDWLYRKPGHEPF